MNYKIKEKYIVRLKEIEEEKEKLKENEPTKDRKN